MANLGSFRFNTKYEYVDVAESTGLTFQDGTTYIIQCLGACRICASADTPDFDGFEIKAGEKFAWTKKSGENLYIKTYFAAVEVVIAE